MGKKTKVLVTACGASGGMGILKSLRDKSDIDLVLTDAGPYNSGFCYIPDCPHYIVPSGDHPNYADDILKIAKDEKVDMVFPVADEEVFSLAERIHSFEELGIKIITSDLTVIQKGADKGSLMGIARDLKIPHPKTLEPGHPSDIDMEGVLFPLVVKPRIARGGQGIHFVHNQNELRNAISNVKESFGGDNVLVQELIPGGAGSIYVVGLLLDDDSQVKASFTCHSLKTKFPFGGPAVVGEPVKEPGLVRDAIRLVNAIGPWKGPINVEFKKDERDGQFKLFEINPRIWGYNFLATEAGIDFPYLTVKIFRGDRVEAHCEYSEDVVLVRCLEDKVLKKASMNPKTSSSLKEELKKS